jgi:PAS domain S-box-containing protein
VSTDTRQLSAAELATLAAIVLSSGDAFIAKAADGTITSWNNGATEIYGYRPEDMIGRNIEVHYPPEERADERARHDRVLTGVSESGYRCMRLHADGRRIPVVMSMSPIRDSDGVVIGTASISRPVSTQELDERRFASLLDAAPDAMVCVEADGTIAMANAQVSSVFGYSREELIGASLEILVPEEFRDAHHGHRDDFFADPTPRSMGGAGLVLRARHKDGSTFPVQVSLAADTSSGDTLAIAAVRDVSEQQAIQTALLESEAQLRQLAESLDAVFTLRQIDPPKYLYISPGMGRLTGYSSEDMVADPSIREGLFHPDDRDKPEVARMAQSPLDTPVTAEFRIVRADGAVRWVRSTSTPVPNPLGTPQRIVTASEDITDRVEAALALQRAEATARAANEAKNEFLSRMSHELRTPLNAVLGFGQLLEHHLGGTEHADYARHIVRAGRHLLDLINEVLDIARIEAGEMSLSPEPVEVSGIVDEAARLMQPLASDAEVTLVAGDTSRDLYVLADRQRLRQILLNLISNAVKYNRVGGSVWLSWSVAGPDRISISVRDDGPGIAPDLHDRMFVPFDRLGAEGSGIEGTGVGLTVTRGLTQLMGGELTFDSPPDGGTTFTVSLPVAEEPVGSAPDRATAIPNRDAADEGTKTVLYIEDNEPNVRVMESLLALRPEWSLIHAALASLGTDLARTQRPDLVLLDLHLPDGSGLDVLRSLRADPATASIPVVVLSADASATQIHRLMRAGATEYLTKPLDLPSVLKLLDVVAGRDSGSPSA